MKERNLQIETVPVSLLKEATYNPRKLTPKQEEDLTASIKKFGLVDPLIVNGYPGRT